MSTIKLSEKRLKNHPELEYLRLTGDNIYVEVGTVFKPNGVGVIHDTSGLMTKDGSITLLNVALVLAVSPTSEAAKEYGIKAGDTVILSKEIQMKPTVMLDNQHVDNPFSAYYSFKTGAQEDQYILDRNNGFTLLLKSWEIKGVLGANAPQEVYPKKSSSIIVPSGKIIN